MEQIRHWYQALNMTMKDVVLIHVAYMSIPTQPG